MNELLCLVGSIISVQTILRGGMEDRSVDLSQRYADYKCLAAELEAKRAAVQTVLEHNRAERVRLYESANAVLDEATRVGNCEMARIALHVIQVAHSKIGQRRTEYERKLL